MASVILCESVRGLILAHAGEHAAAERHACDAVRFAAATDSLEWHGKALLDQASVLDDAGRTEEAVAATEEALRLFEQKEVTAMVTVARERLGSLAV